MGLTFSNFRLYNSEIEFSMLLFVNLWIWELVFVLELTVEKVDNSMNSWLTAFVVVERLRFENQSLGNWFENFDHIKSDAIRKIVWKSSVWMLG